MPTFLMNFLGPVTASFVLLISICIWLRIEQLSRLNVPINVLSNVSLLNLGIIEENKFMASLAFGP